MQKYSIFGLILESELSLSELLVADGIADIFLKLGRVPETVYGKKNPSTKFDVTRDKFLFFKKGVAKYYIENGTTITVQPCQKGSLEKIKLFLYGSAFSALLYQRGFFQLHAGAVKINDQAVIFAGASGSGKSTIATALFLKGFPIISDDLAVIDIEDDRCSIFPSFPRMKLWEDAFEMFNINSENYPLIRPGVKKYGFTVLDNFCNEKTQIDSIYFLIQTKTGNPEVVDLSVHKKFRYLKNNTHRLKHIVLMNQEKNHFINCMDMAKKVRIMGLVRPFQYQDINKMCRLILSDLEHNRHE